MFDPETVPLRDGDTMQAQASQSAKAFFATILLMFVVCGLAIYLLAPQIGMAPDLANRVAGIMLLVCGSYALMLYFWDRVFGRLT